jgi:hypothetical protein
MNHRKIKMIPKEKFDTITSEIEVLRQINIRQTEVLKKMGSFDDSPLREEISILVKMLYRM